MKKGDIILIPFPFTDLTGRKNRPALILIDSNEDVTVSFITSQIKWEEKFDIRLEPSNENGLKKTSLVRLRKITTIDKELIIGKLGQLSDFEIHEINRALIALLDLK